MTAQATSSAQVALVTGASRGIGAAIALELAVRGYQVVGTATTDEGATRISQALSAHAGCRGVNLNVNDAAAVETLLDAIVKQQGGLQVLVNNAGITRDTLAMRMMDEDWDAVMDTNLKAVFRVSRAAIRTMMKQRFGRIINITSVVGASGNPGQANYAAAKAGVAGMTRALARELGSRGITVNCVAPGFIDNVNIMGQRLAWHLQQLAQKYPDHVLELRGKGLLAGIKIATPVRDMVARLRDDHQMLTIGAGENVLRLLPPLIVSEADIEEAMGKISAAFEAIDAEAATPPAAS